MDLSFKVRDILDLPKVLVCNSYIFFWCNCVPGFLKFASFHCSDYADKYGYGVVRQFVGHGVGRVFHADPVIMHCSNHLELFQCFVVFSFCGSHWKDLDKTLGHWNNNGMKWYVYFSCRKHWWRAYDTKSNFHNWYSLIVPLPLSVSLRVYIPKILAISQKHTSS